MLTSSSGRILNPSTFFSFSTTTSPIFGSNHSHRYSREAVYRKSRFSCRCSLQFREKLGPETGSNCGNSPIEEEIVTEKKPPVRPETERRFEEEEEYEISGIQVPRQKYIPILKSKLLDAIVLNLVSEEVEEFLRLAACLDSILHAEHKRLLEDMRVDYAATHVHVQDEATSKISDEDDGSEKKVNGFEGEIRLPFENGMEELRKILSGASGKKMKPDSGDSRLAAASRFQQAFVKLLYDAQFEELSAWDLKLTSALNTDYLLTLPIYVDWKKASESNAIIFRRGYAAERQKGLLLVEKLDYLQSKLLQKIFFIISKPLGKMGTWINEILKNACETPEVQSWTKKLKVWMEGMSNNQQLYSIDDGKSEDLLGVDQLPNRSLPIWLAAQRAAPRYEGLLSSVGPRGRLLRKIMTWTGFITPTPEPSSELDTDNVTSETYARPIFLPRISLNDIWRPASLKACRNDVWTMLKTSISILLTKSTLLEPAFQELILMYTKDTSLEDTVDEVKFPSLEIKIYENIPIPDIPVIFPHKKLSFRIIDTVRLDAATIVGLLAYFINYKFENIAASPSAVVLDVVAITALIIYVIRVVLGYKQTWDRYQLLVNRTLYEKTIASGFGSVHFLFDASEQQQYKEAILAYAILLRTRKGEVSCGSRIGDQCERFMYQAFKKKVKMPIDNAIATLLRLGLVTETTVGGTICPQALSCPEAYETLIKRWNSLLN